MIDAGKCAKTSDTDQLEKYFVLGGLSVRKCVSRSERSCFWS